MLCPYSVRRSLRASTIRNGIPARSKAALNRNSSTSEKVQAPCPEAQDAKEGQQTAPPSDDPAGFTGRDGGTTLSRRDIIFNKHRREIQSSLSRDGIIPGDLSATLEAHREINRTGAFRRLRQGEDPNVTRPSFTQHMTPEDIRRAREDATEHTNGGQHGETIIRGLVRPSRYPLLRTTDLESGASRVQEIAHKKRAFLWHQHLATERREFLVKFEKPPMPIPTEEPLSSQIEILRRVRRTMYGHAQVKSLNVKILDYLGQFIPARAVPTPYKEIEPWLQSHDVQNLAGLQRLEAEIEGFADWVAPTETEKDARRKVFESALEAIQAASPELSAEGFGSQITGLALPSSDIDIRVFWQDDTVDAKKKSSRRIALQKRLTQALYKIQSTLTASKDFTAVVLRKGKYPLVGAQHTATGVSLQIVATSQRSLSGDKIQQYLLEHPQIRSLYIVVKTMLELRGLSDVWNGGLGSYSIFMLIAAYLRSPAHQQLPSTTAPTASTLLALLHFYSPAGMAMKNVGIDAATGAFFPKKRVPSVSELEAAAADPRVAAQHRMRRPWRFTPYMLVLQDAADAGNDLGHKSFAIKHVQATLETLHRALDEAVRRDVLRPGESLLRLLIGRCDQVFDERRARLELFGEGYLDERLAGPGAARADVGAAGGEPRGGLDGLAAGEEEKELGELDQLSEFGAEEDGGDAADSIQERFWREISEVAEDGQDYSVQGKADREDKADS